MKPNSLTRLICRSFAFAAFLAGCGAAVAQIGTNTPLTVTIASPTNGETLGSPVGLYSRAEGSLPVAAVKYFAGTNLIGVVTNSEGLFPIRPITPILPVPLPINAYYFLLWSNLVAGDYTLTAVAIDRGGNMATSAPVNITVTNVPLTISITSPTDGTAFVAPADIGLYSTTAGSLAVKSVQYFAGTTSLGIVTNGTIIFPFRPLLPLGPRTPAEEFYLLWSNVADGNYRVTAVATDGGGNMATSAPVNVTVTKTPLTVSITNPTNTETFTAPATFSITASVTPAADIKMVQFFASGTNIGTVTNGLIVVLDPPGPGLEGFFVFTWTNVGAGDYALTAVVTDSAGSSATSAPVNIVVRAPINLPSLTIIGPKSGETFVAPTNIEISAGVSYLDIGAPTNVEFFANSTDLGKGVLKISSGFSGVVSLTWTNPPPGNYALTAVGTGFGGIMVTSAPVNITVTNLPLSVGFFYPTNGQLFVAPANIGVHAKVADSLVVETVQYFAGANEIGAMTNTNSVVVTSANSSNPFFFDWTNVPAGTYKLTAVATDSSGVMATSAPATIYVVSNLPAVVTIYAPDPVAIEGTNGGLSPIPPFTNVFNGTNDATFVVQRSGGTNAGLTVFYSIGGTASNGVDYALIPNSVTIPAGQTYAQISIVPLSETNTHSGLLKTVILQLTPSPAASPLPTYTVGSPPAAEAIILEDILPVPQPGLHLLGDTSVHVSVPGTDGQHYCVQTSTDLVNWMNVCTNTAVNGSVQYIDPNGTPGTMRFYRIVPVSAPASY